jgi:hypothetical protein
MNKMEGIDLKKMIKNFEGEYQDNTNYIREVKHSDMIREDIRKIMDLKTTSAELRKTAPLSFIELAQNSAFFLFKNYTDIFNKIMKDELDMDIMLQTLSVLKRIENAEIDQNEGSVLIGQLLKELYVDSALKMGNRLDLEHPVKEQISGKPISWREWKNNKKI